jgi:hypothetical protein
MGSQRENITIMRAQPSRVEVTARSPRVFVQDVGSRTIEGRTSPGNDGADAKRTKVVGGNER